MGRPRICDRQTNGQTQQNVCHLSVKRERRSGGGGRKEQNGFLWAAPRVWTGCLVDNTSGLEGWGTANSASIWWGWWHLYLGWARTDTRYRIALVPILFQGVGYSKIADTSHRYFKSKNNNDLTSNKSSLPVVYAKVWPFHTSVNHHMRQEGLCSALFAFVLIKILFIISTSGISTWYRLSTQGSILILVSVWKRKKKSQISLVRRQN